MGKIEGKEKESLGVCSEDSLDCGITEMGLLNSYLVFGVSWM